jgi:hypothetical protein
VSKLLNDLKKIGASVEDGKVKLSDLRKVLAEDDIKELQKQTWEKKLLKDALDVQGAVNILGISKSFARALDDLYAHVLGRSSLNDVKKHPVTILWVDKIHDLVARPGASEFIKAYDYADDKLKTDKSESCWSKADVDQACDICQSKIEDAYVDGRTKSGPWANMCLPCWKKHGVGKLGTGFGQKYDAKTGKKIEG